MQQRGERSLGWTVDARGVVHFLDKVEITVSSAGLLLTRSTIVLSFHDIHTVYCDLHVVPEMDGGRPCDTSLPGVRACAPSGAASLPNLPR